MPADAERAWDPDPLIVGDRVRIRVAGECRACTTRRDVPRYDQRTGTVMSWDVLPGIDVDAIFAGHDYTVRFDAPVPLAEGKSPAIGAIFARAELERL